MTFEQIFNIDVYLTNNGQKAKLNRILAEVCEALDGTCNTDELCTQLKLQCAEAVYKQNIAMAGKDFISGDDPYPRIKSRGMFPVGNAPKVKLLFLYIFYVLYVLFHYKPLSGDGGRVRPHFYVLR